MNERILENQKIKKYVDDDQIFQNQRENQKQMIYTITQGREVVTKIEQVFQKMRTCRTIQQINSFTRSLMQEFDRFIITVHPSYKSSSSIRISCEPKQMPLMKQKESKINPYVYKPKSYSTKRNNPPSLEYIEPMPIKKIKRQLLPPIKIYRLDFKKIDQALQQSKNYFEDEFFKCKPQVPQQKTIFPLQVAQDNTKIKNSMLCHKIEIVSSQNKKILIDIHDGLLKANTNHSKIEDHNFLKDVVNPLDLQLRNKYSEKIRFVSDYKSGYTPIVLQNRSKKEDEEADFGDHDPQTSSKHFIRKKQATLSLPRKCGVSYIRESESKQQYPYDPLPPIIFQCSSNCNYTTEDKQKYHNCISELILLSQNSWLPVIIVHEDQMRSLLLGNKVGRVAWIKGIQNIWPLFNQCTFLLIIFSKQVLDTEEKVWKNFNNCSFKIGILSKKSTSGKKLFLKSIQTEGLQNREQNLTQISDFSICKPHITEEKKQGMIEQKDSQQRKKAQCKDIIEDFMRQLNASRTVLTMSLKLEMYVNQAEWKLSDQNQRNLYYAIIVQFEDHMQKKVIQVIRERLELAKSINKRQYIQKYLTNIRFPIQENNKCTIEEFKTQNWSPISLETIISLNKLFYKTKEDDEIILNKTFPIFYNDIIKDKERRENEAAWQKNLKSPIYYISTRDSFAFDLVQKITLLSRNGRIYKKIDYFFEPGNTPSNFTQYKKLFPDLNVGVTCYHNFFSEEELAYFEKNTLETQKNAFKNKFLQMTVQPTIVSSRIKRTKFFFGYRYMWTRCQLAQPMSFVGAGVRKDVTPPPKWVKQVENPMVEHGIVEKDFLNSVAINVYHDGTEGLAQHFDDAVRFKQPIYTLRLVSDGRLSFGSQFYGFCNGAFIIPLPRGCICVMTENSYAANGVKHCVRPCDMSGKSAALILRQMHHQVVSQSAKYDQFIDFPSWLSTLSSDVGAITYGEQKRRESQYLLTIDDKKKERVGRY